MRRAHLIALGLCASVGVSVCAQAKRTASKPALVTVPFVGCRADGQTGPERAPTGRPKAVAIDAGLAGHLAFYKFEPATFGVLAPRGWDCFGLYGSNGDQLVLAPRPIKRKNIDIEIEGPGLVFSKMFGGTSGRFAVARVAARIFPFLKPFVLGVVQEHLQLEEKDMVYAPYPHDQLKYKSKSVVEFKTPGDTEGLGTHTRLVMNHEVIEGVAIIVGGIEEPDLWQLSARLPKEMHDLMNVIVNQVERDAALANRNM